MYVYLPVGFRFELASTRAPWASPLSTMYTLPAPSTRDAPAAEVFRSVLRRLAFPRRRSACSNSPVALNSCITSGFATRRPHEHVAGRLVHRDAFGVLELPGPVPGRPLLRGLRARGTWDRAGFCLPGRSARTSLRRCRRPSPSPRGTCLLCRSAGPWCARRRPRRDRRWSRFTASPPGLPFELDFSWPVGNSPTFGPSHSRLALAAAGAARSARRAAREPEGEPGRRPRHRLHRAGLDRAERCSLPTPSWPRPASLARHGPAAAGRTPCRLSDRELEEAPGLPKTSSSSSKTGFGRPDGFSISSSSV